MRMVAHDLFPITVKPWFQCGIRQCAMLEKAIPCLALDLESQRVSLLFYVFVTWNTLASNRHELIPQ